MLSAKIAKASFVLALPCLVAGFFSAVIAPARADNADNQQRSAISEEASAAVARMSKTLAAKQFSFEARTFRSYVGANGAVLVPPSVPKAAPPRAAWVAVRSRWVRKVAPPCAGPGGNVAVGNTGSTYPYGSVAAGVAVGAAVGAAAATPYYPPPYYQPPCGPPYTPSCPD